MLRYVGFLVGLTLILMPILPISELHPVRAGGFLYHLGYGKAQTMAWSPNGEYLAIASRYSIWIYDDEFNEIDQVFVEYTYELGWSPSNSKLAITVVYENETPSQVVIWDMPSDSLSSAFDYGDFQWHPWQDILALEGADNLAILEADNTLLPLELPDQPNVWEMQWSTQGEYLAITTEDGLHLWNLTQKQLTDYVAEGSIYGELHWLGDDQYISIVDRGLSDVSFYLFNVTEHTLTQTSTIAEGPRSVGLFSPDGSAIALTFDDPSRIAIIDSMTGAMTLWETGQKYINDLAWSEDGQWLANAFSKHNVQVWDVTTQQLIYTLETEGEADIFWHPTQPLLTLITADQLIELWDIRRQKRLHTVHTFNNQPLQLNWSRDGLYLVVGSGESPGGTITRTQVWNVQTTELVEAVERSWVADYPLAWQPDLNYYGTFWEDSDIFWSRDGQRYVTDEAGLTQVWQVGQTKPLRTLPDVTCVKSISASGRLLHACNGTVWDLDTGNTALASTYRGLAWHPYRDQFAIFAEFDEAEHIIAIAVKDAFTGETVEIWLMSSIIAGWDLTGFPMEGRDFQWSPDGSQFFWSGYLYHVGYIFTLFDVATHVATSGYYPMTGAMWRPGEETEIAGYYYDYDERKGLVQLREAGTWQVIDEVEIPLVYEWDSLVNHLEWSPDGYYLAIGHIEGTIFIWDIDSHCFGGGCG